ncbi:MAG: InlB B-repeat-containing protein [Clostridiales bacterium]|jgi:uncharacterized repeat protein (TIGR02543 family)|nr:InlB B-repeat-containing protein [Clostridiales bacterium]
MKANRNNFIRLAALAFLCAAFLLPAPVWGGRRATVRAAAAVPFILRATDAVSPGELFSVNGEYFAADAEAVLAPAAASPDPDAAGAFKPEIVQRDGRNFQYIICRLPADKQGAFDLWVKTAAGTSAPYTLNAPRPLFLSEKEAWAGQTIDVSGRNFDLSEFSGFSAAPQVRLAAKNGGTAYAAQLAPDGGGAPDFNPYRLRFTVPDITPGEYEAQVSTGNGVWRGLADGQALTVVAGNDAENDPLGIGAAWARHINWGNERDINDFGQPPAQGANDNARMQLAADYVESHGGGVVYLPNGTYKLDYLELPDRVVLRGESQAGTVIEYAGVGTDNRINSFIRPKNGARGVGYTGIAGLTIRNADPNGSVAESARPQYAPDVYVDLGDWREGADARDYTNEGYFLKDVSVLSGLTRAPYHSDGHGGPARQRGRAIAVTGSRIVLKNVTTQTFSGVEISKGQYCRIEDSSVTYANKQFNVLTGYSFILNVKAAGKRAYNPPENLASMHGFMCRDNIHFEGNDISGMGAYTNDGEIIGLEVPGANYGFGKLAAATATGATFDGAAGIVYDRPYEFSDLAVVITDGRGKGQLRYVERPEPGSRTVTFQAGQRPWDVTPEAGSMASLLLPIENTTLYGNKAEDCAKGILLFGNNIDVAAVKNDLNDTEGILAWAAASDDGGEQQVLACDAFIGIRDNVTAGKSFRNNNNAIALTTGRNSQGYGGAGSYKGTQIYTVDIRRNTVRGADPDEPLKSNESEFPLWPAYAVSSAAHSSPTATGDGAGDITNVLLQGNRAENTRDGVHYSNCIDGLVLTGNTFGQIKGQDYKHDTNYGGAPNINFLLYAPGAAAGWSVTFETGGGTAVESQSVAPGGKAGRPDDPTREGYAFEGWYKDSLFGAAWDFGADTVDQNVFLYAKWRENDPPAPPPDPSDPDPPDSGSPNDSPVIIAPEKRGCGCPLFGGGSAFAAAFIAVLPFLKRRV